MSVRLDFPNPLSSTDMEELLKRDHMGITALELDDDGRTLTINGWFDQVAKWTAMIELSDEQAEQLREGLRA